jgi:hypothetical protein
VKIVKISKFSPFQLQSLFHAYCLSVQLTIRVIADLTECALTTNAQKIIVQRWMDDHPHSMNLKEQYKSLREHMRRKKVLRMMNKIITKAKVSETVNRKMMTIHQN